MAIHIEGITVIVRHARIGLLPRGVDTFQTLLRNGTFATDTHLVRAAFMDPAEVELFVNRLEAHGLTYESDGLAVDISVADQNHGLMIATPWLDVYEADLLKGRRIQCAALKGASRLEVAFPISWRYESSLYAGSVQVPLEHADRFLKVGTDSGVDMLVDLQSGKAVYKSALPDEPDVEGVPNELPRLDLPASEEALFAREEAAIEFARLSLLRSGETPGSAFAPAKRWFRPQRDRHSVYPRPNVKNLEALTKLYGLWRFPPIVVGMAGLLYGREAGRWAGEVYDELFRSRQQVLAEELERYGGEADPDRPCFMRVPVPNMLLAELARLPAYDSGLRQGTGARSTVP